LLDNCYDFNKLGCVKMLLALFNVMNLVGKTKMTIINMK
jgi:hypothetical protein